MALLAAERADGASARVASGAVTDRSGAAGIGGRAAIVGIGETDYVRGVAAPARRADARGGRRPRSPTPGSPSPTSTASSRRPATRRARSSRPTSASRPAPRDDRAHGRRELRSPSLQHAALAVSAGLARNVLVVVGWNGYSAFRPREGVPAPAARARRERGRRHRRSTSTCRTARARPRSSTRGSRCATSSSTARCDTDTGEVAVTFREHAQHNDKALMRGTPLTMDDYLASRVGVASRSACSTAASRPTARRRWS